MTKNILIGGAPGTGKTTIARQLADQLHIAWISTDQIREIVRAATNKELSPELFAETNGKNPEQTLQLEIKRAESIWPGIVALLNHHYPWDGCIIEGIAILPHLVARDFKDNVNISALFLIQDDMAVIKKIVYERSLQPWIKTKTPEQQAGRVEQVLLWNKYLQLESKKYNYPCINLLSPEENVSKILDAVHLNQAAHS